MEEQEFLEMLVEMANHGQELDDLPDHETLTFVMGMIADSDIAMAIWRDASRPNGIGFIPVKGPNLMRQIILDNDENAVARITAIPCTEAEQALALLDHLRRRARCHGRGHQRTPCHRAQTFPAEV
jgi:hypothetical protein